jgi:hypothetical protein
MPSVAQSQGSRAVKHYFTPGLAPRNAKWFAGMIATQSVLFTRHTKRLDVDMTIGEFTDAFPKILMERIVVINGKSQSKLLRERARRPDDQDDLLMPFFFDKPDVVNSAALPLSFSNSAGDHLVTINANADPTAIEKSQRDQPHHQHEVRHGGHKLEDAIDQQAQVQRKSGFHD